MIRRLWTVDRLCAGFGLLLLGGLLSLPGVPGPGILLIALGLWLLSSHFVWARKTLSWVKRRIVQLRRRARQYRYGRRDGQRRASMKGAG